MSFQLPKSDFQQEKPVSWPGMAMMVEAMMLLVFLAASILIITALFLGSASRGKEGRALARAVAEATTVAERFAADPAHAPTTTQIEDLELTCEVSPETTASGTLYHATITVRTEGVDEPVYVLETACYERGSTDG